MPDADTMKLTVFTPEDTIFHGEVCSLTARGHDGAFGLLPRHVDYVAPLVPSIVKIIVEADRESFVAIDGGVLVKTADDVRIATRRAVSGDDLTSLGETVKREFLSLSEHEKEARSAVARLEAGIVRRFVEMGESR